jgi:HSP20 family protein
MKGGIMPKEITKWDPFRDFSTLRSEMERVFDSMLGRYPRERVEGLWAPLVDVEETKDNIVARIELPGMKKEDIKVTLVNNMLTVSGERKHQVEEKGKTYYRIERAYGKFQRTVELPTEVLGDKAKATYKDGILELVIPKSEKAKEKEIAIEVS